MANRFLGEVASQMGGQTYTLRLDINTMIDFEEASGLEISAFGHMIDDGSVTFVQLRTMAHCALQHHHPDATLRDAGVILSENPTAVVDLLVAALPSAEEIEGLPKPSGNRKAARKPKASTT